MNLKLRGNNKIQRKTQIGVFVIITIIIIILGVVFFSFKDTLKIWNDQKSSYKVKEFVESCLESQTRIAENKIGLHGGWLYSPLYSQEGSLFVNKNSNKYMVKSGLGYEDLGGIQIPYWFYYDDTAKSFKTYIPEFASVNPYSIRNQIKRYIKDNILVCIDKFNTFKNIYDIKYKPEDLKVNVYFIEDKIDVNLDFPLEILELNTNDTEFISKFNIETENKIKIPYYLAKDIISAEVSSAFIEKRILSFLTPYQTTKSRDLLPPYYDFKLTYDFKPWNVKHVEKVFKEILSSNINLIQFANTNAKSPQLPSELRDNEFAQGILGIYNKDYLSEHSKIKGDEPSIFNKFKEYEVKPTYEVFFPTYFHLSPSMGDIILLPRPEALINLIPFFFTEYVAVYEVTNPIVFEIKKSGNYNDKFLFNLAVESNIDHNTPLIDNKQAPDLSELDLEPEKTLICDPVQFISDWVYLNLSDPVIHGKRFYDDKKRKMNMYETGIEDAIVTFNCKDLTTCFVGTTTINGKYKAENITTLKFRLPINCNPGKLEISKWGYDKLVFENLDPKIDEPIDLGKQYMASEKTFKLNIGLVDPSGSKYAELKPIKDNETGFIIVKNLKNKDFVKVVEFNKDNQYDLNISLLPGNYSISGYLLYEKNIVIPREKICPKSSIITKKKCAKIPQMNLSSWMKGAYEIEKYEVPLKYLVNYNQITIPIINFGIPHTYSQLQDMSNIMSNVKGASLGKTPYFDK